VVLYSDRLSVFRPAPNLEDQVSVFITPGDRVTQLYRQALASSGPRASHFPRSQLFIIATPTGIGLLVKVTNYLIDNTLTQRLCISVFFVQVCSLCVFFV
jgi:hypothetical protein